MGVRKWGRGSGLVGGSFQSIVEVFVTGMGCGVCGRDDCDRGESVYMGRYLVNHAVFDNPKTFLFFSCLLPRTRGFFPFVFFFFFFSFLSVFLVYVILLLMLLLCVHTVECRVSLE